MFNMALFLLLLLSHILADFYFQTANNVKKKLNERSYIQTVFKHSLMNAVICLCILLLAYWENFFKTLFFPTVIFTILGTHFIIDFLKSKIIINYEKKENLNKLKSICFFFDQALHIIVIFIIALLPINSLDYSLYVKTFYHGCFVFPAITLLKFLVSILFLLRPVSIIVNHYLYENKIKQDITDILDDKVENLNQGYPNGGKQIGYLERLIVFVLILSGNAAGIVFVLTAKSLVRYSEIQKDISFAEYFLIGTLLSTLLAVVTAYCFIGINF